VGDGVVFRLEAIESEPSFRRGDCNGDGTVDISDVLATVGFLFLGEEGFTCDDACDSNDDGTLNFSDPIATLDVQFKGEGVMPLPGTDHCGGDPTEDGLGCEAYAECP
jgi:hypothetical protein